MYKIIKEITDNDLCALAAIAIYGFSKMAIQTVEYVRFYEMYNLFTLLFFYNIVCMIKSDRVKYINIGVFCLLIWLGYGNSQYMLFMALYGTIFLLISLIYNRRWEDIARLVCFGLVGLIIFIKLISSMLVQTFSEKSNVSQLWNAVLKLKEMTADVFWHDVKGYYSFILEEPAVCCLIILALITVIVYLINRCIRKRAQTSFSVKSVYGISFVLMALGYIAAVAVVAPKVEWRYISNIWALLIIGLSVILTDYIKNNKILYIVIALCICLDFFTIGSYGRWDINTVGEYNDTAQEVAEAISGKDIIYMDVKQNRQRQALIHSAYFWSDESRVFITAPSIFEEGVEKMSEILMQDDIIVWVNTESAWENKVRVLMENCGYTQFEYIYEHNTGLDGQISFILVECRK